MEYNKIISITGLGGLFELLSSKSDGAIVRSLDDNQTKFVSSRLHNFSHLESIEVYTTRENINLVDLFQAMQASGEALPSEKDASAVKGYFQKVYPEMDFERIYNSDMKKMVRWYSLLTAANVEFKLSAPEEGGEDELDEEGDEVSAGDAAGETTGESAEETAAEAADEAASEAAAVEATGAPAEKTKKKAAKAASDAAEAASTLDAPEAGADEEAPKKKAAPKKKKTEE